MVRTRSGSLGGRTIECLPRPVDLPEDELLELFERAIAAGVFTDSFMLRLARQLLKA